MPTVLEIKDLGKKFGALSALSNISLCIEEGAIFGIIGLSGAGKSTLVRCLAHLDVPTCGRILFNGRDVCSMSKQELRAYRKEVGMIFQHFNLLTSRTAAQNISYPLEIAGWSQEAQKNRTAELLKLVKLTHKGEAFPATLSGGEKQRVGIARAVATHPKLLLCDEATSALDPQTTYEILSLLKTLNEKLSLTIVMITHEMDVIKQICSHVAVLDQGCVVEEGPVSEVFADPKHAITRSFLQQAHHELPAHLIKPPSEKRKLLRLSFKGESAKTPVISQMVRAFAVDANILMGWVDALKTTVVGTLIIEITGERENILDAMAFLKNHTAHVEEIEG